jgi:hypothetical protein
LRLNEYGDKLFTRGFSRYHCTDHRILDTSEQFQQSEPEQF